LTVSCQAKLIIPCVYTYIHVHSAFQELLNLKGPGIFHAKFMPLKVLKITTDA